MFATLVLAAMVGTPPCWDVYDTALRRRAAAAHPAYVTYDEYISLIANDQQIVRSTAHIDYRDDGVARVSDTRFDNDPFVTLTTDPGPPELGPYGEGRLSWLPLESVDSARMRVIGDVHAHGTRSCTLRGVVAYHGHRTYRVIIGNTPLDRPAVKELLIDTQSFDIWKVVARGFVLFKGTDSTPPLTDFQVELGYAGPYLVVDHVTWHYRLRQYSQYDRLFGEYYFSDFDFPKSMPATLFTFGSGST